MTAWRTEARQWLQAYPLQKRSVAAMEQQIQILRDSLRFAGSDEKALEVMERVVALSQQLAQTRRWLELVDKTLEALPSKDRELLRQICMDTKPNSVDRYCMERLLARSTVYRNCRQAMGRFVSAMYGQV